MEKGLLGFGFIRSFKSCISKNNILSHEILKGQLMDFMNTMTNSKTRNVFKLLSFTLKMARKYMSKKSKKK